jgi:hypothetical protein
MKKLALSISLLVLACPAWATTYYLSPTGSDSNDGTSANAPWLTPNHSVACGDVIIASAGAYAAMSFSSGKWGTVTCVGGNNVAWLECATFDACKITGLSRGNGFTVTSSYWGVQGWEVDGTSASNYCFIAQPPTSTPGANIHHIIFANDIATGCGLGGIESGNNGTAGVDYFVVVGNIVYDTSGGSATCGSGLDDFSPVATDTNPGTHIYFAGNFSWANHNPSTCGGAAPTDGEGIIFDTFDGSGPYGAGAPYAQQAVIENNIVLGNGGPGIEAILNYTNNPNSHIYLLDNTAWGNNTDTNQTLCACVLGEFLLLNVNNTLVYQNIGATNAATGPQGWAIYAAWVSVNHQFGDAVYQNDLWSATGSYTAKYDPMSEFTFGPNNINTNPSFANATVPGAPSCGSFASVPACMATVIANFTPTTAVAKAYGYQIPSTTSVYDPLFPQWLCNVNLPLGLVTMGCLSAPLATPTNLSAIIK